MKRSEKNAPVERPGGKQKLPVHESKTRSSNGAGWTVKMLNPFHTTDSDPTKLFCRVGVDGVNRVGDSFQWFSICWQLTSFVESGRRCEHVFATSRDPVSKRRHSSPSQLVPRVSLAIESTKTT